MLGTNRLINKNIICRSNLLAAPLTPLKKPTSAFKLITVGYLILLNFSLIFTTLAMDGRRRQIRHDRNNANRFADELAYGKMNEAEDRIEDVDRC